MASTPLRWLSTSSTCRRSGRPPKRSSNRRRHSSSGAGRWHPPLLFPASAAAARRLVLATADVPAPVLGLVPFRAHRGALDLFRALALSPGAAPARSRAPFHAPLGGHGPAHPVECRGGRVLARALALPAAHGHGLGLGLGCGRGRGRGRSLGLDRGRGHGPCMAAVLAGALSRAVARGPCLVHGPVRPTGRHNDGCRSRGRCRQGRHPVRPGAGRVQGNGTRQLLRRPQYWAAQALWPAVPMLAMYPLLLVRRRHGPARRRGRGPVLGRAVGAGGNCGRAPRRGDTVTRGPRGALMSVRWWRHGPLLRHRLVETLGGLGPLRGGLPTDAGSRSGIEGGIATGTGTATTTTGEAGTGNRSAGEVARAPIMTSGIAAAMESGQVAGGTARSAAVPPISCRQVLGWARTPSAAAAVWAVAPREWPAVSTAAAAVPSLVVAVP